MFLVFSQLSIVLRHPLITAASQDLLFDQERLVRRRNDGYTRTGTVIFAITVSDA
jgi:hypothetical protein